MPEMTRVEIEHHYGWTTHNYPVDVAPDLPTAAKLAVRETHPFLTDANHTSEPGSCESPRSGSVVITRLQNAPQLADPILACIAAAYGNSAGDCWFSTRWREWHPHGTLAVDDHGRRWAMVRLSTGYGKWECLTDLTMLSWELPGPCATRSCCGSGNLEGKVCPRRTVRRRRARGMHRRREVQGGGDAYAYAGDHADRVACLRRRGLPRLLRRSRRGAELRADRRGLP